ncbi:MAG: GspE/PulE family protein [Candidatus Omnitrophota bacterium]
MAISLKNKILEALRSQPGFSEEKFTEALRLQKTQGGSLGKILIEIGALNAKDYMLILSRQFNIPPINLSRYRLDPELLRIFPEEVLRQNKVIPLSKLGDTLTVALVDPLDIFLLDRLKAMTNAHLDVVLTTEADAKAALESFWTGYGGGLKDIVDEIGSGGKVGILEGISTEEKPDQGQLTVEGNIPPIVKIVNLMLVEAHKKRASDIHIEPGENSLRIRYRIDGVLHEVLKLPKKSQNAIIARLKILSRLDITQTHIPQDGRFRIRIDEKEIDRRVSVLPTSFGNKVVLRILDKGALGIGLDRLGFSQEAASLFRKAIECPYGMILVTGPTGSGKSTTLYSILNQLNTPERNIITLEDPVEYQVEGITQMQARSEIGLTFASGLRAVLRQNPDIIMVGEIRDAETADIAIKASLTGQMVLSTLHTNDAPTAITRLADMGVEPFLIASSLVFVCAQRLCRKICPHCKEECEIPRTVLERLGIGAQHAGRPAGPFYRGKGCPRCGMTGFHGRVGILEALFLDGELKTMITHRVSGDLIRDYAVKHGMKTLWADAVEKVCQGVTTLEEALSVTLEDQR